MSKSPITTAIDGWINSRKYPPQDNLKVFFEGKRYKWSQDFIFVSTIPVLNFCTYQLGLEAKMWEESGLLPVPDEEFQRMGEEGTKNHKDLGDSYEMPEDVDFSRKEVLMSPRKGLRKLLKGGVYTREFPICQKFKDIVVRGRIDLISFNEGLPNIEEWKFPKNGRVKPTHIEQAKIYAYLISSWLGVQDFPYSIRTWPMDSWNREEEVLSRSSGSNSPKPTGLLQGVFTEKTSKEVEGLLNSANEFFTGGRECTSIPDFCTFCPVKENCKHYEKRPWIEGKLISNDYKTQEAIINFKEVIR